MNKVLNNEQEAINIGVVTSPISKSGCIPTSNLLKIICSISNNVFLITGNYGYEYFKCDSRLHVYGLIHEDEANPLFRILSYIYMQLKIAKKLLGLSKNIDIWIFFIGGESLLIPLAMAKLLRKKVIISFTGSSTKIHRAAGDKFSFMLHFLSRISCRLCDCIVVYSPNLIDEWNLSSFVKKISIAHEHFINLDCFYPKKPFIERNNLVGYVGRFSEEKGIINFINSIPLILTKRNDLRFVLIGDGALKDYIDKFLKRNNLTDVVEVIEWVQHESLPNYLNELKLLVLPSYTEGLPNIMLESMACGTPVLSTSVGSIPDIIKNRKTGFIISNNSPECIAEGVINALKNLDLVKININSRTVIEKNFTFNSSMLTYKKIIYNLL